MGKRGKEVAVRPGSDGRHRISLRRGSEHLGTFFRYRIVWEAFCGPIPEGMQVDHMDGCCTHDALENLQLLSQAEHTQKTRESLRLTDRVPPPPPPLASKRIYPVQIGGQLFGGGLREAWVHKTSTPVPSSLSRRKVAELFGVDVSDVSFGSPPAPEPLTPEEEWRQVEHVWVSSLGRVCVGAGQAPTFGWMSDTGYRMVRCRRNVGGLSSVRVHRLVALAFLGPPPFEGAVVDHIDRTRTHNHVTNLRWVSHTDNIRFACGKRLRVESTVNVGVTEEFGTLRDLRRRFGEPGLRRVEEGTMVAPFWRVAASPVPPPPAPQTPPSPPVFPAPNTDDTPWFPPVIV